ncbi:MAG: hypothetical protein ABI295_02210 [Xanthomarina sp.]
MNTNLLKTRNFLILFFILIFNCQIKTDENLEKTIYYTLFNDMIDSTITDYRSLVVPSMSDFEDLEKKELLQKRKEKKRDSINEPLKITLINTIEIIPDVNLFFSQIKKQISSADYESIVNNKENISKKSYEIITKKISIDTSKYDLLNYDLKNPSIDNSVGKYRLSRIFFNQDKNLGVLKLSIVYGKLNAVGVLVIIRKENDKWNIDKIIEDWIS